MRRVVFILILLVFAAPASASLASLEARSANLESPFVEGGLAGIEAMAPATGGVPPASLRLSAETLEILVDHEAQNTSVATVSPPSETWRSKYSFTDATAEVRTDRQDAYLLLLPAGGGLSFKLDTFAATALTTPVSELQEVLHPLAERAPLVADVSAAHSWIVDTPTRMSFQGDFLLVVWDYDVDVDAAEGAWRQSSGEERHSKVADVDPVRGIESIELRQFVLRATQAELELDVHRPEAVRVLAASSMARASLVRFEDARGTLASRSGAKDVVGDLDVEGRLTIALRRGGGDFLGATVDGEATSARLGSQAIPLEPVRHGGTAWPWILLAAGTLALAVGGLEWRYWRIRGATERYDFETTARLAPLLLSLRYRRRDTALLLAIALARLDRLEDARRVATRLGRRTEDHVARHYLLGYIEARKRRWGPARKHLVACIEAVPALAAQIQADPLFSMILSPRPEAPDEAYS